MTYQVVVIGASNLDIIARTNEALIPRDSNRGTIVKTPGGVARNIAENLGRLDIKPVLLTGLSTDANSDWIKHVTEQTGVKVHAMPLKALPTYIAVLDEHNDMVVGINDMVSFEAFKVTAFKKMLSQATHIVIDLNVSTEVLDCLAKLNAKLYVDGISTAKVKKIKPYLKSIYCLKLNTLELEALTNMPLTDRLSLKSATKTLLSAGVNHVFVTQKEGVLWANQSTMAYYASNPVHVENTTGAGDAFLAGVVYGDLTQQDPAIAGLSAAKLSLESVHTVSQVLSKENIETIMEAYKNDDSN